MNPAAFASEAELCSAFMAWASAGGGGGARYAPWVPYPETGGFDILLVDEDGRQLGIEAKLRLNAKVLVQAMPDRWGSGFEEGPDWRGILVPNTNGELAELAMLSGLVVFRACSFAGRGDRCDFQPPLYYSKDTYGGWFDWNPERRVPLPETVPNVRAGVPGPVKLTAWKEGALKVLAHLAVFGSITAREVRSYGVDPRRFCATDGWLVQAPGNAGHWTRGKVPAFELQHPEAYEHQLTKVRAMQDLLAAKAETPDA